MKVKELIEQLKECNQEDDVVIDASDKKPYLGGCPYNDIKGIYSGFDWDDGKVYIKKDL